MSADGYPRPYADVSTLRGAVAHLTDAVAAQVEQSVVALAPPNTPIPGDAHTRRARKAISVGIGPSPRRPRRWVSFRSSWTCGR